MFFYYLYLRRSSFKVFNKSFLRKDVFGFWSEESPLVAVIGHEMVSEALLLFPVTVHA